MTGRIQLGAKRREATEMSKRTQRNRKLRKRGKQSRAKQADDNPRHGKNTLLWHYTTMQCFEAIFDDGFIRPATAWVADEERPIVWFSSNQEWEPTSTKIYVPHDGEAWRLSKEELRVTGNGLVRFGVTRRTARLDWTAIRRLSGMSRDTARDLKVNGRRLGSKPESWFGSFDAVQHSEWVAIDVLEDGQWVRVFRDGELLGRCA